MGALRTIERFVLWWVGGVIRAPWLALLLVLGLAVGGGVLAATTLKINTDASDMIEPSLPYRQAQAAFTEAFPDLNQTILVVVKAPTPDMADAFTARLTTALRQIDGQISGIYSPTAEDFFLDNGLLFLNEDALVRQLQRITRARSLLAALNEDPSLGSLFNSLARSASLAADANRADAGDLGAALDPAYGELAQVIEARLGNDPLPFSWQRLMRPPADPDDPAARPMDVRVISVAPALDYTSLQPARAAIGSITALAEQLQAQPGWERVDVGITGNPALRTEELRSVSNGIALSFGLSFVAVTFLLWLAFRSVSMLITALLTLVITLAITSGFTALAIGSLNLVSIAFTVLLIGLGIDYAIHLALHVLETLRRGETIETAIDTTVHEVGGALALCAPTTAFAFFAFVPTDFVGMAQLGVISGTGVVIAFLVAITVIPAAMAILPTPRPRLQPEPIQNDWSQISNGPAGRALALFTATLCLAAVLLLPQVRFDADPMSLRNPESPSVKAFLQLFETPNTVPYRLNILTQDPETAVAVGERIERLPDVARTVSLLNFVPRDQDTKLDHLYTASLSLGSALEPRRTASTPAPIEPALEALLSELADAPPDSAGARLARALRRYADIRRHEDGLDAGLTADIFRFWPLQIERLRRQLEAEGVSLEDLPTAIRDRYQAADGTVRLEVAPAAHLDLMLPEHRRTFVEAVEAAAGRIGQSPDIEGPLPVTGSALTVLRAGEVVSEAMLRASIIAGVVVLALLWVLLRDIVMVGLIMMPVVLAAICTSATGVLLNQPYNFANVIVIPLLIGLGADNGIHLALRSRQMPRQGAVFNTTTPRAVLFSALTTIASFGSLALSEHRGTASMGALLTIALGFTLFSTLIVLPAAMDFISRRRPLAKL